MSKAASLSGEIFLRILRQTNTHLKRSGPTPRVVAATSDSTPRLSDIDVQLRITRDARPVHNVLLGEQLTLNVESSMGGELQSALIEK